MRHSRVLNSGHRGRAEGGSAYKEQVPEDHSLLYSLMNAQRKDDGRPLSDLHICAQAFTFVLAGKSYIVIRMLSCCMHAMQSYPLVAMMYKILNTRS